MKLSFHGAAQDVTGSCHLLECAGLRILVDCGMFQGNRELTMRNQDPFGFDPSTVDYLLLTHAHLDHCGRIPLLVKRGFRGEIITTAASKALTKLVLMDSAHVQEEDAYHHRRRASRHNHKHHYGALYSVPDVLDALDFFGRTVEYDESVALNDDVTIRFIDAGHILGSAAIAIDMTEGGETRRIVFSGDLGSSGRQVLCDPTPPPEADYVVMETTYGDRRHKSLDDSIEELYGAIIDTLSRGGNVIIPTFALERAQEILYYLKVGVDTEKLPRFMSVYLDSPMAITATEIFARFPEHLQPDVQEALRAHRAPFDPFRLHLTRQVSESVALNHVESGAVILAGAGMCNGGRVRHHFKHNLWRHECSVVFVGFAAKGTLAREIIDGAETIRLFGQEVDVKAKIYTINGFSAHADRDELLEWYRYTGKPRTTFLVHGDDERGMKAMAETLRDMDREVICPEEHEAVELD